MRDIQDILNFRTDISPFLVHLTRDLPQGPSARDNLTSILWHNELRCGPTEVSDARFGMYTLGLSAADRSRFLKALCFTETPLSEVHNLLEIEDREVNLAPYGLVLIKERLAARGVSPVLYFNNLQADKDAVFQGLCSLRVNNPDVAAQVLPLVSVFGQKIQAPGVLQRPPGDVDWRWEREWRLPFVQVSLRFDAGDVFVGLCPHEEIAAFEARLPGVGFIDPTRNMKWYATTLIRARHRFNMTVSVV